MVPISQAPSDQIPDATASRHSGPQRTGTVCASLAVVLPDAYQLPSGHPRSAQDVGHGTLLSGCRLNDGEYLILVSAEFCEKPHEEYQKRWGIETLFAALKSRGFNLEDTHIQDPERLSRLLAL